MPFQSEKQRRYLHANHPEIAKRWERDYAHGGILDINESEEIISDDGNEIELTDYNAAFDEPTGVQSLFQAKEGGTPRRRYFTGAYGGGNPNEDRAAEESRASRGPRDDPDRFGPTTTSRSRIQDEKQEDFRQKEMAKTIATGPGSDWEKYDTDLVNMKGKSVMTPQEKYLANRNMIKEKYTGKSTQRLNALKSNYNKEKARLESKVNWAIVPKILGGLFGGPLTVGWGDIKTVKNIMDLDKLKKQHIADLTDIKESLLVDVDINNPNEMVNLDDTAFPDVMSELTELTKTRDDEDDRGGPELPPQLGGPSTEEMATEYGQIDWLGRIRAGQQKYKDYLAKIEREKLAREDNPIVSGTEMDIIALGNSGGLANLFRVKKQ